MKRDGVRCPECGQVSRGLTKKEVQFIYQSEDTLTELAKTLDLSYQTIYRIKHKKFRKEWTDEVDE